MKQVISIVVAVLVGVGVAVAAFHFGGFGTPAPLRAARALTSPDEAVRAKAIAHWSEPTGPSDTPRLFADFDTMDALKAELPAAPDGAVRALGDAFADAPQWLDQFPGAQEKYLIVLAGDPDKATATRAFEGLERFSPKDDLGRIANVLDKLTQHTDADVRLCALEWSSYYLGRNEQPMVDRLLDDPDQAVARTAWIHLGLINPSSGNTARWREAPWRVAHAMLFAAAITDPDHVRAILKQAGDDENLGGFLGDTPFFLRFVADGHPPQQYVPGEHMDGMVHQLADDVRRAHWLLEGTHPELLKLPTEIGPGGTR